MDEKKLAGVLEKLQSLGGKFPKSDKLFETKYGYFTNKGREFVIKTPHTPGLWANFLTNGKYTALLTPTGGGYSWLEESAYNRILREHPLRHLTEDTPGRYVFIKDVDADVFWSATYQPVQKADRFQAVHSLGYTTSSTQYRDIACSITYFVPIDKTYEIWSTTITNNSRRRRHLKIYTYCEFVLGAYDQDILENPFNNLFASGEKYSNALIFTKPALSTKYNRVVSTYEKTGFITSNQKFTEYELSRRDFVGFGNSLSHPQALSAKTLSSCSRSGENLIGCISFDITLLPGQTKQLFFAVGAVGKKQEINKITRSLDTKKVKQELDRVTTYWSDYIRKIWITTPDVGLNIWFNYWLKYQLHFNAHWSEMDSFYIGGGGGFGYRDTAQHIWGIIPFEKELYLSRLRFLLSHQYPNGAVPHGVSIFKNVAFYAPHSDDACWLVFAVLNYIEETNDHDFLKEIIPFADTDHFGKGFKGSVLKHIIRATDHSLRHLSERGIPQMRIADWNDALSTGELGKGESFLVAGLLAFNLKRMTELMKRVGRHYKVEEYTLAYKRLAESVGTFGWDGEWFLRASSDHLKKPIGSHTNERGKIFLDSNTWLCISGLSGAHTQKTLESLWEYLMTKYGALLFNPAYSPQDRERGIISQFVKGSKENAAIFLHANAWFLIALSQNEEGGKAWELLQRINPVYSGFKAPETYKVEPYVLPEFIFGNESDKFGEGSFTWVTGSTEWFFRGILDYFLGLRPEYEKLVFEPKTPKDWEFSVEREFQGKRYRATYRKGKSEVKEMKS